MRYNSVYRVSSSVLRVLSKCTQPYAVASNDFGCFLQQPIRRRPTTIGKAAHANAARRQNAGRDRHDIHLIIHLITPPTLNRLTATTPSRQWRRARHRVCMMNTCNDLDRILLGHAIICCMCGNVVNVSPTQLSQPFNQNYTHSRMQPKLS